MINKTIATLLLVFAAFVSSNRATFSQQISINVKQGAPVSVGATAPDFTLIDQDGRQVQLSAEYKKQPVVLVFYRGYWWPYCARQLAELRSLLKSGEQVSVWAISIDSAEQSKALAEKIAADGMGKITFSLLSDPQHQVIDDYSLRDPRYAGQKEEGIPYPAVYVIDKTGKVAWARIEKDYKQRPTNSEIRAAINALRWASTR